ncbi:MAG: VOC family protein [Acidobacteriia bacterium]|nr:VOC family protein [Terriglobia bacterium]
MLGKLSHIAIVVHDLEAAIGRFRQMFGARLLERDFLPETRTDVAVVELGGVHFELLSSREPDSKVGRILREKGEGLHHLSFDVPGIVAQIGQLQSAGVRLLDEKPRRGVHGRQIAFIDPRETSGVLIEMVEESSKQKSESIPE